MMHMENLFCSVGVEDMVVAVLIRIAFINLDFFHLVLQTNNNSIQALKTLINDRFLMFR